jgi:hypothetical protein
MHYNGRTFLSTLTFAALQPFSLAGWIPSREPENVQQYDGGPTYVTLPDLGGLAKYVCPNTNILGRKTSNLSPISDAEIRDILEMLKSFEESTLAMVNSIAIAGGVESESATPSLPPIASSLSLTLGGNLGSAGTTQTKLACPSISTVTVSVTSTITETLLTTASSIYQQQTELTSWQQAESTLRQQAISTRLEQGELTLVQQTTLTNQQQAAATSTTLLVTPISPPTVTYQFNAMSQSNVAVYFGQTAVTGGTTLEAQCADPNIDIVILAFVIEQLDGGLYPQLNFGAACGGQTPAMVATAPGLVFCPELASNITACQNGWGKKVMLSIGGDSSSIQFANDQAAETFATVLWNLFGPPGNVDSELRPFGAVEVDGFDIGSSPLSLSSLFSQPRILA